VIKKNIDWHSNERCVWEVMMFVYVNIQDIAAIVAGVAILAAPKLLNYIVAIYLILIGVFGLLR
jgi:general stress protein CsbA